MKTNGNTVHPTDPAICHEQPSQPPDSCARVSLHYFSPALIHLVPLVLSPNCTFVYHSGNISLEFLPKSHPSVAPYSKWILCAAARSEGREYNSRRETRRREPIRSVRAESYYRLLV